MKRRTSGPGPLVLALLAGAWVTPGHSEQGPSAEEEVVVTATRVEKPAVEVPAAVSAIGQQEIQLGRQQLGIQESLAAVPGVFLQDEFNFAQDLRISIRGFGARGNFGIRGVKVLVDDIPATLPDGQGQVDAIDVGSLGKMTVLRGPSSSLYGNASGGVILLESEEPGEVPFVEGRVAVGDFGFLKPQLKAGGRSGALDYVLSAGYLEYDGFRDQSEVENKNFNSRFRFYPDDESQLTAVVSLFDSPKAQDPGGLTAAEVAADPTQAAARNVQFDAGEEVSEQKVGLSYKRQLTPNTEFGARLYSQWRDFANRLPFTDGGLVEFDRTFYGGGLQLTRRGSMAGRPHRVTVGLDVDKQDDDRQRYENLDGIKGAQTFDQTEQVTSYGLFAQVELDIADPLTLTLGARYDDIKFDVNDRFLSDGDDSGDRSLDHFSPMGGLLWRVNNRLNLYGNISTAFETPTTTEFANPSGGGFNPDLDPQTAVNYEVGAKARTADGAWSLDFALFRIETEDEITPFELPQFPGRTFFQNAGESTRDGAELGVTWRPITNWVASLAYTYSDFTFDSFSDGENVFDGNRIPGIPKNFAHASISYVQPTGLFGALEVLYVGKMFADNANSVEVDSYTVAHARLGYRKFFGNWEVTPFVGVNNIFDEDYPANVRINAAFGRYFEPAPERNYYGGVTVRYDFR